MSSNKFYTNELYRDEKMIKFILIQLFSEYMQLIDPCVIILRHHQMLRKFNGTTWAVVLKIYESLKHPECLKFHRFCPSFVAPM